MYLTKIWTALLAILATICLAGMFLVSSASQGEFSESDKAAVQQVAEGALVAFEADIAASPVAVASSLISDPRIKAMLDPSSAPRPKEDEPQFADLQAAFAYVANEGLLQQHALMSVALVDKDNAIVAKTGIDERLFEELVGIPAFTTSQGKEEDRLSATLGGKLYAVSLGKKENSAMARRVVAIMPLNLGGTSFLRRVLGDTPAGLVRDGQVLGDPIGGADPKDLVALVNDHRDRLPRERASAALEISAGDSKRLGAIGRVPGPAGQGDGGTIFAVISKATVGTGNKDLATQVNIAMKTGGISRLPLPILAGLLVLGVLLAFLLPRLEVLGPLQRLEKELEAMSEGTQQRVFHESYRGPVGAVAASMARAQEAVRQAWVAEVAQSASAGEGEGGAAEGADAGTGAQRRLRTGSVKRVTKTHRSLSSQAASTTGEHSSPFIEPAAIPLPASDDAPAEVERGGMTAKPSAGVGISGPQKLAAPPAGSKPPGTRVTAATLSDDVEDPGAVDLLSDVAGSGPRHPVGPVLAPTIGGVVAPVEPAAPARAPTGGPPALDRRPAASADDGITTEDAKEAYFRSVYDEFVDTKRQCGEPLEGFTFDKFEKKLRANTAELMARPGVKDVEFTVYVKDGKAALKAKVVKE